MLWRGSIVLFAPDECAQVKAMIMRLSWPQNGRSAWPPTGRILNNLAQQVLTAGRRPAELDVGRRDLCSFCLSALFPHLQLFSSDVSLTSRPDFIRRILWPRIWLKDKANSRPAHLMISFGQPEIGPSKTYLVVVVVVCLLACV